MAGGCLDCCVIYCVGVRSGPGLPCPARGKVRRGFTPDLSCGGGTGGGGAAGAGQRGRDQWLGGVMIECGQRSPSWYSAVNWAAAARDINNMICLPRRGGGGPMLPLLLVSARVLLVVVKLCSTQTLYRFTLHLPPVANCRVHSVTSHQGGKYLSYLLSYLLSF